MGPERIVLALPKGRVLAHALGMLTRAGLEIELDSDERKLHHVTRDVHVLVLRNSDVPTYVELGVADAGVVGKDILVESGRNVFEPVDLMLAKCRLSLIRQRGASGPITRVASKYPKTTAAYLRRIGSAADVVPLSGNVELACISGLADAVVDVVDTGRTLRANGLEEVDVILLSTARFIVNRAALKLKAQRFRPLIAGLRDAASDAR